MRIQVFTDRGCGHWAQIQDLFRASISESGEDIQVEVLQVTDYEEAKAQRYFGSPTIRIDGVDIEYGDREPLEYRVGCRYYNTPEGWKPLPDKQFLTGALKRARTRARGQASPKTAPRT